MTGRFASRAALRDKIEWEGGIFGALDYGIKSTDMPLGDEDLNEVWGKLAAAFQALQPLAAAVEKLLDVPTADEDEDPSGRFP